MKTKNTLKDKEKSLKRKRQLLLKKEGTVLVK